MIKNENDYEGILGQKGWEMKFELKVEMTLKIVVNEYCIVINKLNRFWLLYFTLLKIFLVIIYINIYNYLYNKI